MVDTPRTVAELKTIFADNSIGAISAQDMRDYVESIANPLSDGGLFGWTRYATDTFYFTKQTITSEITLATNTDAKIAFDASIAAGFSQVEDPLGMLMEGPWDYFGDQPLWSVLAVPPGLWFAEGFVVYHDATTTGKRDFSFYSAEETWDDADTEPYFGNPSYHTLMMGRFNAQQQGTGILNAGGYQRVDADGMLWVPPTGTAPGGRTAMFLYHHHTAGSTLHMSDFGFQLRRVS